jgi:N utilization substance protein B
MINRHFLRAKVLQVLYAYKLSNSSDLKKAEKNLIESVNNLYNLQVYFFSALIELKHIELNLQEEAQGKFYPTEEEKSPNIRFVENKLISQLEDNLELKKAIAKEKINWNESHIVFKKLLSSFKSTEAYKSYMKKEDANYDDDKAIVVKLFKNFVLKNKELYEVLCEKNMQWESDCLYVYEHLIKFLKEYSEQDTEEKPLLHPFEKADNTTLIENDENFMICLFRNTIEQYDEFDQMISKRLENWDKERLAFLDTLIIKLGISELIYCPTIPIRVTLNEYIELSKEFSTERSKLFVNGMLDRLVADLRYQGLIKKEGRGIEISEE